MSLTEPSHFPDKKISSNNDDNVGWTIVAILILSFTLYIAVTQ